MALRDQLGARGWVCAAVGAAVGVWMLWKFQETPWTAFSFAVPGSVGASLVAWYFPAGPGRFRE